MINPMRFVKNELIYKEERKKKYAQVCSSRKVQVIVATQKTIFKSFKLPIIL
jgi:hypothetical protein